MDNVTFAKTEGDFSKCYPVFVQLHPNLDRADFIEKCLRFRKTGYQIVFNESNSILNSVAGIHVSETFAWGRYLCIDDFVTNEHARSMGHGHNLIEWIYAYAKKLGCGQVHLDSRITRHAAHKFYINHDLLLGGYHFYREI